MHNWHKTRTSQDENGGETNFVVFFVAHIRLALFSFTAPSKYRIFTFDLLQLNDKIAVYVCTGAQLSNDFKDLWKKTLKYLYYQSFTTKQLAKEGRHAQIAALMIDTFDANDHSSTAWNIRILMSLSRL